MTSVLKWINYHRYSVAALALTIFLVGCGGFLQPKATSPISGQKVTKDELSGEAVAAAAKLKGDVAKIEAEIKAFNDQKQGEISALGSQAEATQAKLDAAVKNLDAQQAAIDKALEVVSGLVQTVPGPWSAVLGIGLGLATAGVTLDNRRKNGVIADLKAQVPPDVLVNPKV